ncbi:hypothetical protein F5880DRAFT_1618207 [Lentinula raphanica]|nr:hypothetical protein F5880DRAFT_1618207 [Lentinula raphanica]
MPETQKTQGRRKFDVSLAQLSRPGVQSHHFKTYKPPDMVTKAARECETETNELTPQQAARKRYEERNLELRRKKARERMAQYVFISTLSSLSYLAIPGVEHRIMSENEKRRDSMKKSIVENIENSVGTRKIAAVPIYRKTWRQEFSPLSAAS